MATDESETTLGATPLPGSRWGALGFRDFRFFWAHGLFLGTARNMREMLTFLLVYQISDSALQLGLTGLFQGGPAIVFGLIGGALADTVNRKKLMVFTQAANIVSGALVVVLIATDVIQVWHLWAFTAFWSSVSLLGRPAQRAYVPRLVPKAHLVNAITWYGALGQGTLFIGPLIAGFLVVFVGMAWAYVGNVVVLTLALLAVVAIRASGAPDGPAARPSARTVWEGVRFVRKSKVLLSAMVMDTGVMSVGFVRPLLPILALDVYHVGETGLGVMNAAMAVGAVLGTIALLKAGDVKRKGALIVTAYAVYAIGLGALGLAPWFALALPALALLGFMDVVAFTIKQALIQIIAPDNFRGRAASLSSILSVTGNSVGAVEMGSLAAVAGAPAALIINSAIALGLTVGIGLRWMGLWRYRG
jgi:MFS family permease